MVALLEGIQWKLRKISGRNNTNHKHFSFKSTNEAFPFGKAVSKLATKLQRGEKKVC